MTQLPEFHNHILPPLQINDKSNKLVEFNRRDVPKAGMRQNHRTECPFQLQQSLDLGAQHRNQKLQQYQKLSSYRTFQTSKMLLIRPNPIGGKSNQPLQSFQKLIINKLLFVRTDDNKEEFKPNPNVPLDKDLKSDPTTQKREKDQSKQSINPFHLPIILS